MLFSGKVIKIKKRFKLSQFRGENAQKRQPCQKNCRWIYYYSCFIGCFGFVGRLGLTRVVEKVDSSNQFQLLVDHIVNARQNEKRFILTNDPKAVIVVEDEIGALKRQAKGIVEDSKSKEVKKQAEDILKKSEIYPKAFKDYLALAEKKDTLMGDMNQKASIALETTAKIGDEQKAEYDQLRDENESKISQMRQRVSLSIKMNDAFLEA